MDVAIERNLLRSKFEGNFKRETESLRIVAKRHSLCGDRDEMINHIIIKCSKLVQKEYKMRYNWVVKVIHCEVYKKFQFDHTNKWYMHNPAAVLENATFKLQRYFDIQTDHLISA